MSAASIIFDADTGRYVSNVDNATKATQKTSDAVAKAKNAILDWSTSQIKAAQSAGKSFDDLQRIQTQAAARLATVTEQNANRVISALDRQQAKAKAVAAEMERLNKVVPIDSAPAF